MRWSTVKKCEGCLWELDYAYECQCKGLHLATTKERDKCNHILIIMVNDKGQVMLE